MERRHMIKSGLKIAALFFILRGSVTIFTYFLALLLDRIYKFYPQDYSFMKTNIVLVLATGIIMLIVVISMEKRLDDHENIQESSLQMKRVEIIAVGALLLASVVLADNRWRI